MPAVTTSVLVTRAKVIADMHDNFVTPAEWMYWATQERLSLDYLMARSGWVHNATQVSITATGSGDYSVGSTVPLAVLCVHESSTQGFRRLRYNNTVDFKRQAVGGTVVNGAAVEYSLKLDLSTTGVLKINFFPEPTSGTYVVTVIAANNPLALTAATGYDTSVVYPQGWEERIVLGMARRALVKEESETSALSAMIKDIEDQVERAVWNMVTSEAPTVRNGDVQNYGWDRDIYYPPSVQWRWF